MSIRARQPNGYYNDNGQWVRLKHCFIQCPPERCDCMPHPLPPLIERILDRVHEVEPLAPVVAR